MLIRTFLFSAAITGSLLTGCGSSEEAPSAANDAAAEAPAEAAPEMPELSLADLTASADNAALVPSPVETQRALEQAGIETTLSSLIPEHTFDNANGDTDHAALRTGVILADALLTVKTAKADELITRLQTISEGMKQLGGGDDIQTMLTDMQDRIKADAVTRDELLREFDEMAGAVIPELEFNGQERVVPLIQAGSWLEGANLVAKAVEAKGNPSAADSLLKQPSVVTYFIGYVAEEGSTKAPAAVTAKLQESLNTLKTLAEKQEPLTADDIKTVIEVTSGVLALL